MKGVCTWTRFETEAEDNSEMAYSLSRHIRTLFEAPQNGLFSNNKIKQRVTPPTI